MDIDWSKAPQRASHYCTASTGGTPWRDYSETDGFYLRKGVWKYQGPSAAILGRSAPGVFVPRPVPEPESWTGEGLPPVGTVCEYMLGTGCWYECAVRYVITPHADCPIEVVIFAPHLRGEQVLEVGDGQGKASFRPIRTAGQIAAEERGIQRE